MRTFEELERFAEELSSADRLLCDSIADGTYRLGEACLSETVSHILRSVFADLVGHQEKITPDIFDGEDPFIYVFENALSDEPFREKIDSMSLEPFYSPEGERFRNLLDKIESSLVFGYYTMAVRRDREQINKSITTGIEVAMSILGDNAISQHKLSDVGLFLLGYVPGWSTAYARIFSPDRYRPYESKLIMEIPYCEFIANLFEGVYQREHFGIFGLHTEEQAKEFAKWLLSVDEELAEFVEQTAKRWELYKISDFGVAVFFSQATLYKTEAHDNALRMLKKLKPENKVEHLLVARAWENLARATDEKSYLQKAHEYYTKAGNFIKAIECEVLL